MFTDETPDSVGVESLWRKTRQFVQETRGCQTRAVHTHEAENQAVSNTDRGTQTEPPDHMMEQFLLNNAPEPEPPGLMEFLHRVEHMVTKELAKNSKSHAFDGFHVDWEDHSQMVSCLHQLQQSSAQESSLHVTSISWNCTGSVIACAYGRIDDGDWSTTKSCVCTWNLDRRGMNPKQPDMVMDVPAAVTALSFHPTRPSLIAGGLYTGEVVVWDTSKIQEPTMAQTRMSADSHREPVYQVEWIPHHGRVELGVLSACSRGRVLLWTIDADQGNLVLTAGYALVRQQVPHTSSAHSKTRGSGNVGVSTLALSPWDPDSFLVGSESGLLLKCSFSAQTPAAVASEGESLTLRAPAVFSFNPHAGPVHSVHCSPFHRNLFLSVGTDGLAHLHSVLQASPLLSMRVGDSYVFGIRWSPTRPLVFAAATGEGAVQIFDLGCRSLRPAATIEKDSTGHAASCLAFNCRHSNLLAVGSTDGAVYIWQLSTDLTEQGHREMATLEQLVNEMAE